VGGGLFVQYVRRHPAPLNIVAYCVQGLAGMFLVFGGGAVAERGGYETLALALVIEIIAAGLALIQRYRSAIRSETLAHGVDTDATVTRAAIMGRVNAAPLWHLTLTFTDQQGTQRWFRTHLLGINWAPGDAVPIRYDPAHQADTARIIVASAADGDMIR
jgi:hypothetical protein